jgi:hypothetical protein
MPRKRVCPEFPGRFGEYPKALLEPIVRQKPLAGLLDLTTDDEKKRRYEAERDQIRDARHFKLTLLAKHFGLDWNGAHTKCDTEKVLCELAALLMLAHVPGMQIVDAPKRRRGAPRKAFPDIRALSTFVTEVDAIEAERKKGISDAIIVWKRRNKNDDTEPKLRARYYRQQRLMKKLAAALDGLEHQAPSK